MAGDWIKMRVDLADDPAVISIAARLDLDEDTVVGKLHRMWSWFDKHTRDGNARRVTASWIDRFVRCDGFGEALSEVGWLAFSVEGVQIPNFSRHNGQTGKARALTAKRVAKSRSCNADGVTETADESVTGSVTNTVTAALPEKRREEKNREESKSSPSPPQSAQQPVRSSTGEPATWAEVAEAMRSLKISRREQTMKAAQRNGFNPAQVLAIIDYLNALPATTCESPAGSLCDRLGTEDAADWDCNENWPWSTADKASSSPYDVPPAVQQENAKRLESENLERKRKYLADGERRELAFGEKLNAMSSDDLMVLIGGAEQVKRGFLKREYQAKGRDSPEVRYGLLEALEARESEVAVAS